MRVNIDRCIDGAERAGRSCGTVVVIDVLRAFTTAPHLFAAGAGAVFPVAEIDEAFSLRDRIPGSLIAGERGGIMVPGFDLGNSPEVISGMNLGGRSVIMCTSAGTQGVTRARGARQVLLGSFVTLTATAEWIRSTEKKGVTIVAMGDSGVEPAEEDELCAAMLRDALLFPEARGGCLSPEGCCDSLEKPIRDKLFSEGRRRAFETIRQRVLACPAAEKFLDSARPEFPRGDLDAALDADRFEFALRVTWPCNGGPAFAERVAAQAISGSKVFPPHISSE